MDIRCTTKTIWDLWHCGLVAQRIAPLSSINPRFDLTRTSDKVSCSKANGLIEKLMLKARSLMTEDEMKTGVSKLSSIRRDALFETSFLDLAATLYDSAEVLKMINQRRIGDRCYVTLYDRLQKRKEPHSGFQENDSL